MVHEPTLLPTFSNFFFFCIGRQKCDLLSKRRRARGEAMGLQVRMACIIRNRILISIITDSIFDVASQHARQFF